jgi:hypothetical protein
MWRVRTNPQTPFERYADDAIIHCKTEMEAEAILGQLKQRLEKCRQELHPLNPKIIYCQDKDRKRTYPNTEFDFLGYTVRRMFIKNRLGRLQFKSTTPLHWKQN